MASICWKLRGDGVRGLQAIAGDRDDGGFVGLDAAFAN